MNDTNTNNIKENKEPWEFAYEESKRRAKTMSVMGGYNEVSPEQFKKFHFEQQAQTQERARTAETQMALDAKKEPWERAYEESKRRAKTMSVMGGYNEVSPEQFKKYYFEQQARAQERARAAETQRTLDAKKEPWERAYEKEVEKLKTLSVMGGGSIISKEDFKEKYDKQQAEKQEQANEKTILAQGESTLIEKKELNDDYSMNIIDGYSKMSQEEPDYEEAYLKACESGNSQEQPEYEKYATFERD